MSDDIDEAFKTIRRFLGARRCQDCPYCQELHTTTPPGDPRVKRAIASTGLSHYAPAFAREEIDFDILPDIVDEDLVRMGITKIGARKRLSQLIAQIRSGAYQDTVPEPAVQPDPITAATATDECRPFPSLTMFLKEMRESAHQAPSVGSKETVPTAKETPAPSPRSPAFAGTSSDDGSTDSASESPARLIPIKLEPRYGFDDDNNNGGVNNKQQQDRRKVVYPTTSTCAKPEARHRSTSSSSTRRKRTRSRSRSRSPKRRQHAHGTVRRRHCRDTTTTIASTICVQLKITNLEIENQGASIHLSIQVLLSHTSSNFLVVWRAVIKELEFGNLDYDQCSPRTGSLSNRLGFMFAKHGRVINVYVVPRHGCAFVNFVSADDAQAAMKGLTGHTGQGSVISPFGYDMVLLYGRKNLLEERPFEECSACDSHRHSRD